MPRDPDRIDPIIELLRAEWKANPDLRFGQLVVNLFGEDPFYVEDDVVAVRLAERQNEDVPAPFGDPIEQADHPIDAYHESVMAGVQSVCDEMDDRDK